MKYDIKFSCGHTEARGLVGKYDDRRRKIAWFEESGLCSECYAIVQGNKMAETHNLIGMPYGEYKQKYTDCKTLRDSYDKRLKTIKVYVPRDDDPVAREAQGIKTKALETADHIIFKAGGRDLPTVSKEGARDMDAGVQRALRRLKPQGIVKAKALFEYESLVKIATEATEKLQDQ